MPKTMLVLQPLSNDVPPPPPSATNEMLLARIAEGDGDALWTLYRRQADLLRGVVARVLGDCDECEEVLRELFEGIRDGVVQYTRDKGAAIAWLMTLARRLAQAYARNMEAAEPETPSEAPTPATHGSPVIEWPAGMVQAAA